MVPLDTIAQRRARSAGRCVINRKYLQRIIDVTANVAPGKDLGGASAGGAAGARRDAAARRVHACAWAARPRRRQQAFARPGRSRRVLAIVLVYMVLASQFKSLIDPLVIMFSVPLGVTRRVPGAVADGDDAVA